MKTELGYRSAATRPTDVRLWHKADITDALGYVRFSNRPIGVKRFQAVQRAVSISLAGSRFSSDSALRPFQHGVRRRGGTIFRSTLPSD